jgi:DNA-binding winged helix-turn-helix (wHTH) protein
MSSFATASAPGRQILSAERCLTPLIEYEISLKDLKRVTMKLTDEALGAIEFGRFRLLPHRRELRADGVAVELGGRAFDVLVVLAEARGGLVTKDEILSHVWPDTVVEENNLVVQISALRKALGEDRDFIRTVSGRGYRFVAEIHTSAAEAAQSAASSNLPTPVSGFIGREAEPEKVSDLPAGIIDLIDVSKAPRRLPHALIWRLFWLWFTPRGCRLVLVDSLLSRPGFP